MYYMNRNEGEWRQQHEGGYYQAASVRLYPNWSMRSPLANSFFAYVAKRVFAQLGLLVSRFAISAAITHTRSLY